MEVLIKIMESITYALTQVISHSFHSPGQQDPLVFLQLPHKAGVGLGDCAPLLHIVVCPVQVPAIFLHGIGDHRGCRAAHSHLAVYQALGTILPEVEERQKEDH